MPSGPYRCGFGVPLPFPLPRTVAAQWRRLATRPPSHKMATAPVDPEAALEEGRGSGAHISTLQHLLKLAHSSDSGDQQKAALELSKLVEGTVFPAVSFGPLAHALCKLVPSETRSVACHSARAVKTLLLDDALRPQAVTVGIPTVLVQSLGRWSDELACARELLGALQTLCWDRAAVSPVVEAGIVPLLVDLLSTTDLEVQLLCLATLANLLSYADSVLLAKEDAIQTVGKAVPAVLELANSRDKAQRCYAVAAVANATAHPTLAGLITDARGLELLRNIERQNKANLSLGGTGVAESAETAVLRLAGSKDPKIALRKYRYKWGNKPMMELSLDTGTHKKRLQVFLVLWVLCTILLFKPLVFMHRESRRLREVASPPPPGA